MSRTARQSKILSIISSLEIETQEELVEELKNAGFDVTQATISRDIKELGLIKTLSEHNRYKYVTKETIDVKLSGKLLAVFREAVISIVTANNLIVIKTLADSAAAVASAVEQLVLRDIAGVVADRNTVLAVALNQSAAESASEKLSRLQYGA